jgi:hypothetical protein
MVMHPQAKYNWPISKDKNVMARTRKYYLKTIIWPWGQRSRSHEGHYGMRHTALGGCFRPWVVFDPLHIFWVSNLFLDIGNTRCVVRRLVKCLSSHWGRYRQVDITKPAEKDEIFVRHDTSKKRGQKLPHINFCGGSFRPPWSCDLDSWYVKFHWSDSQAIDADLLYHICEYYLCDYKQPFKK